MAQCIDILFHIYMRLNMFRRDKPPIIRSLNLQWRPLVLHTRKIVGRVVAGRCQADKLPRVQNQRLLLQI
jgi:hypothetical protein